MTEGTAVTEEDRRSTHAAPNMRREGEPLSRNGNTEAEIVGGTGEARVRITMLEESRMIWAPARIRMAVG